ncbi:hypothetical protein ATCC90586_012170 [Pythium insidiosum]|nr:hypothetical protein ATCC90586_012170 [Pythium insidiosum]
MRRIGHAADADREACGCQARALARGFAGSAATVSVFSIIVLVLVLAVGVGVIVIVALGVVSATADAAAPRQIALLRGFWLGLSIGLRAVVAAARCRWVAVDEKRLKAVGQCDEPSMDAMTARMAAVDARTVVSTVALAATSAGTLKVRAMLTYGRASSRQLWPSGVLPTNSSGSATHET